MKNDIEKLIDLFTHVQRQRNVVADLLSEVCTDEKVKHTDEQASRDLQLLYYVQNNIDVAMERLNIIDERSLEPHTRRLSQQIRSIVVSWQEELDHHKGLIKPALIRKYRELSRNSGTTVSVGEQYNEFKNKLRLAIRLTQQHLDGITTLSEALHAYNHVKYLQSCLRMQDVSFSLDDAQSMDWLTEHLEGINNDFDH